MVLIMLLVLQLLPLNIVAEEMKGNETFTDVTSYEKEIDQLVKLDIIKGYPDHTFRPYNSITRAQGVSMIIREMKLDTANRPNPHFKDIQPGQRFYDEIAAAVDEGIIDGYGDGTFAPDKEMTRSQMAKILVGAYHLKLKESESKSFKDVADTHWAHEYINVLASNGITAGYNDGTFNPEGNLTRLHFSLFLSRYIEMDREAEAGSEAGSGSSSGSSYTPPPYQATVTLSKDSYTSGEEVVVQGVVQDQKGQALPHTKIGLDGMETTTDKQGKYRFSFLAIDEAKEYRLYAGDIPLKILKEDGSMAETFRIAIHNDNIDLKPDIVGLNSTTMADLLELTAEKAVFKGKPEGIEKLAPGSVFVTSPTDEYPLGVVGKVVSIQYQKDQTVVLLTEPKLDEVFNKLEVQGTTALNVGNIIPDEGVQVYPKETKMEMSSFRAADIYQGDDIVFDFSKDEILKVADEWNYDKPSLKANFTGQATVNLGGTLELKNTEIEYDISLLKGSGELMFRNEQDLLISLDGGVNGSGEVSKRIGRVFIPIEPPVGIMGSLWVVIGTDGKINFKISYDQQSKLELGTKVSVGDGVDPVGKFDVTKSTFTKEAEGEMTVRTGIKPNLFLSIYTDDVIGLDNEIGVKGNIDAKVENLGTEDERSCTTTDISLYAQSNGALKEPIEKELPLLSWEHSLEKTETCPKPESISIDPKEKLVEKGEKIQLEITGTTADNEERDYTPRKEGTEYTTSDSSVATVSKDGLVTVLDNAPVGKEFTITAKNNDKEATAKFKVIEISKVVIEPDKLQIQAGGTQRVSFNAILTNGEILPLNNGKLPVTFKVGDTSIANVDEEGVVTVPEGVLKGMTTTLTASFQTFEAQIPIEVIASENQQAGLQLGLVPTPPIAAGYEHSVYVKNDGTVWTWGSNDKGQLGDGSLQNR